MVEVGLTVIEVPVPTSVPAQLPEYHFQDAPEPSEPPVTVSVVEFPAQIVVVPEIEVAAADSDDTVTRAVADRDELIHPSGVLASA